MKKALLAFMLAVFSIGLFGQSDINGFRDWDWDIEFSTVSRDLTPSKNKLPRFKAYDKKTENLSFEEITAHLITYGFKNGKFAAVNIGIFNKDLDHIVKVFTKNYGKPRKVDTPFLMNYEWHLKSADISISHFPSKKGEKNTSIGISKKRASQRKLYQ
ncbi:hypothetical protein ACFLTI_00990 [Bacteroidota bacterium]